VNQPREIVDLNAPDPIVERINNRARHAQPQHTLHNGALLIIALACVVIYGAASLAGVGR
jgi:hypothetical protein